MKVRNLIPTAALCCVAASRVAAVPFKVYVVALYLEQPTTDAQAAITTDDVITWNRNGPRYALPGALPIP